MSKNTPVITFMTRTWMLLAFTIITNFLTLWNHVFVWVKDDDGTVRGLTLFHICGAVLYVPGLCSAAVWVALLMTHLFFRQTMDQDAHDGTYIDDWRNIGTKPGARERIYASVAIRIGFVIAASIIAASMSR